MENSRLTAPPAGNGASVASVAELRTEISTEGQAQLSALEQTGAEIAARLGVSRETVSAWRRGRKVPSTKQRVELKAAYGIASASWEHVPDASPVIGVSESAAEDLELGGIDRAITRIERRCAEPKLSPIAHAALERELRQLRSARELTMKRILESEPWRRIVGVLVHVLAPHPELMKELAGELAKLEAGST